MNRLTPGQSTEPSQLSPLPSQSDSASPLDPQDAGQGGTPRGQAASDSQKDESFLPEKVALDAIAQRLKETVYKHQ